VLARHVARRLRAACDLFVTAHMAPNTPEVRESILDAMCDTNDPGYRPGDIARALDLLPPATFDCEWLPVHVIRSDPRKN